LLYGRTVIDARRLVVPLLAALIVIAIALDLQNGPPATGIDFHTYEAASLVGIQQGWNHLYDQSLVKVAQLELVPAQRTQPFLSPPPVAWITAPFSTLPYWLAFAAWTLFTMGALALALLYSTSYRGWGRPVAAGAALVPLWVLHAMGVGQVVPLVAAGILIAWRLLRDERDVLAGVALGLVLLKPNTAMFVQFENNQSLHSVKRKLSASSGCFHSPASSQVRIRSGTPTGNSSIGVRRM